MDYLKAIDTNPEYLQDLKNKNDHRWLYCIDWTGASPDLLNKFFEFIPDMGRLHPPPNYSITNSTKVVLWRLLEKESQEAYLADIPTPAGYSDEEINKQIKSISDAFDIMNKNAATLRDMAQQYANIPDDDTAGREQQMNKMKEIVDTFSPQHHHVSYPIQQLLSQLEPQGSGVLEQMGLQRLPKSRNKKFPGTEVTVPVTTTPIFTRITWYYICTEFNDESIDWPEPRNKHLWDAADLVVGLDADIIRNRYLDSNGKPLTNTKGSVAWSKGYKKIGLYGWYMSSTKIAQCPDVKYPNQVHPYDWLIPIDNATRDTAFTIQDSITYIQGLVKKVNEILPYFPKNQICLPTYDNDGKALSLITKAFASNTDGEKIINLINYINGSDNSDQKREIKKLFHHEAGLVLDNQEYSKKVNQIDISNINNDTKHYFQKNNNHLLPFYCAIGVSMEDNNKASAVDRVLVYPSINHTKSLMEEYMKHPDVELFIEALTILEGAEVGLARAAIDEDKTVVKDVCNVVRGQSSPTSQKITEMLLTPTCPGKSCLCNKLGLFNRLMTDVMHVGEDGAAVKATTVWEEGPREGQVKQILFWNDDDWEKNLQHVKLGCTYYHRIDEFGNVYGEEKTAGQKKKKSITYSRRELSRQIRDSLALEQAKRSLKLEDGEGCIVSYFMTKIKAVSGVNMAAFSNHHLAKSYKLLFGEVLLDTRKYTEVSKIVLEARCFEELIERLFPEILLTRLLDERFHRLLHWVWDSPDLQEELKVKFPFEVFNHKGEDVLKYTGEVPDSFKNMDEKEITFPSVVKYLKLRSEVKIGTKTVAIERKMMTKNDDADSGDESYDPLSSDEESEEE